MFLQYKKPFVLFFTYIDKRVDTVRIHIWIDCRKIFVKTCDPVTSHLNFTQMSDCICSRCGTNVTSFDISNNYQTFFFAVINVFLYAIKPGIPNCSYIAICGFTAGIRCINDSFIILPDGFCCSSNVSPVQKKLSSGYAAGYS